MGMILLEEYARRHEKAYSSVLNKVKRGTFKTAKKIGKHWFINEREPYSDKRIKTGKYMNWRNKPDPETE